MSCHIRSNGVELDIVFADALPLDAASVAFSRLVTEALQWLFRFMYVLGTWIERYLGLADHCHGFSSFQFFNCSHRFRLCY